MARRIVSIVTITPTASADTTALTTTTFPFLVQGGSGTQTIRYHEISICGQAASSSSPTFMIFARDSTVATTPTAGGCTDAAMDFSTAALTAAPLTGNSAAGTQRSSTLHLMNCSLNAFGGVYFWRANKWDECVTTYGNTASLGEVSLTAYTGGTPGALGSHLVYEPI